MSGYFLGGPSLFETKALTGSSATVVSTGDNGKVVTALWISNETGAGVAITIDLYDGTTAWPMLVATNVADDGVSDFAATFIPLPAGSSLRVTGANGIKVLVFYSVIDNTAYSAAPNTP